MAKNTKSKTEKVDQPRTVIPGNLLGQLEAEVMHFMWELDTATVQRVVRLISYRRVIAYTTVMTVMGHLVDKGLLTRTSDGKRYNYKVAQTRAEFLAKAVQQRISRLLNEFGDAAIASFVSEIAKSKPEKLQEIKDQLEQAAKGEAAPD